MPAHPPALGSVKIDWASALVRDRELVVKLKPRPPSRWRRRLRTIVAALEQTSGGWGTVTVKKRRLHVSDVTEEAAADLRHFLTSLVLEANAGEPQRQSAPPAPESPSEALDRRLTAAFRAFAD